MDIIKLYQDYNIDYATEGHKHTREGWVNCACPFCTGTEGLHLGYNLERDYYVCWRCGWHATIATIAELTGLSDYEAKRIFQFYGGRFYKSKKEIKSKSGTETYPYIGGPLNIRHKRYLHGRGFNVKWLEQEFGLRGTGPIAKLDGLDYKYRVVVPIMWHGQEVSFVARDITGKQELRYLTCPRKYEIEEHAKILYGHPETFKRDSCVIVEGVFDALKIGIGAVATFGVKYTPDQLRWIRRYFRKVTIMYDGDEAGRTQSKKLCSELCFYGVEANRYLLEDGEDPGALSVYSIKDIMKNLDII